MDHNNFKNRMYGRTRGRSKKKINLENYYKLINKLSLKTYNNNYSYILDIGTGYGETSLYLAKKFPNNIIISCEKYINGNLNLIEKINSESITNINIHNGNVHTILDQFSERNIFELVWIFFPDPWPKKKHFKRRLISKNFLQKLHPYIKNKGEIYIVTDSDSYAKSILRTIHEIKILYVWKNQYKIYKSIKDYHELETKFYKKAIISGRKPSLFILKKI